MYLYAGFPVVDTEPIRVPGVVLHQLLQSPEGGPPSNEEPSLVQLPELQKVPINCFTLLEVNCNK
jgi:hypothetical protein